MPALLRDSTTQYLTIADRDRAADISSVGSTGSAAAASAALPEGVYRAVLSVAGYLTVRADPLVASTTTTATTGLPVGADEKVHLYVPHNYKVGAICASAASGTVTLTKIG